MVKRGGLKRQKEKRSMDHFAGLDVSVKETSMCIVDDAGKIVREVKVARDSRRKRRDCEKRVHLQNDSALGRLHHPVSFIVGGSAPSREAAMAAFAEKLATRVKRQAEEDWARS